ncbi:MAG: phosphoenolpyruvate carboxylase [Candidatus Magasanikbacteria bacterium]|nr:phosphoenolpyruvate carboxylase [Candidatus Magasanikbacteria bacterium]
MRKIPATMASQHPDHASKPYWHSKAFIGAQEESRECFLSFSEMGISEYKWDWEGKLSDESTLERLLSEYTDFFKKHPIGLEKFLTFRLPNPTAETEFRMGRALLSILNATALAKKIDLHSPPIFEAILPMVESAQQMIDVEDAFAELAYLKHPLYKLENSPPSHLEIIPLFENIDTIINSDTIIKEYLNLHTKKFKKTPTLIRPYIARSDPALNSGLVSTVLAIKIALARYKKFEKTNKISLFPILGTASLPFRGGLTPYNTKKFIAEYAGVKTLLLQSAFRYDFPKQDAIKSIKIIEQKLQQTTAPNIQADDEKKLIEIIKIFENYYKPTIEKIAELINTISHSIPKRRDRLHHAGVFGYARHVGTAKLPRAIGFTASLYSIGIPPEIIGTGRGIREINNNGDLKLVKTHYLNIREDLNRAGKFLNKKILGTLAKTNPAWKDIQTDVKCLEAYLQINFSPTTKQEKQHQLITTKIFNNLQNKKPTSELIEKAGVLRNSLG